MKALSVVPTITITDIIAPERLTITEEEAQLLKTLSPASYAARMGEEAVQNDFFLYNLGYEAFREVITLDSTLKSIRRKALEEGNDPQAALLSYLKTNGKLSLINAYALMGAHEEVLIDEADPVKTFHEMKMTGFSLAQGAYEVLREQMGVPLLEGYCKAAARPPMEHEVVLERCPQVGEEAVMLYGSFEQWLRNGRDGEKPSDIDVRLFIKEMEHHLYNWLCKQEPQTLEGIPLNITYIPSEYLGGVAFFDYKNINAQTTVLSGMLDYNVPVSKRLIALTNNAGTVTNQRGLLLQDDMTLEKYLKEEFRRILARGRGGQEAYMELTEAGYELEKPAVLKSSFDPSMGVAEARRLIAASSLEVMDLLRESHRQYQQGLR
ncbi:MAG: hypothetical protein JW724_06280 [Candidatus Altiarchaeota archaeon]|nr:hypothetical protein [Candidatus Altiarchaeota archaeon]